MTEVRWFAPRDNSQVTALLGILKWAEAGDKIISIKREDVIDSVPEQLAFRVEVEPHAIEVVNESWL
jgi:hypothetical protein